MARCVLTDETAGRQIPGQNPVQAGGHTSSVVSGGEAILGGSETIGFGDSDRQPDPIQEDVNHNNNEARWENPCMHSAGREEVQRSCKCQEEQRQSPGNRTSLDI